MLFLNAIKTAVTEYIGQHLDLALNARRQQQDRDLYHHTYSSGHAEDSQQSKCTSPSLAERLHRARTKLAREDVIPPPTFLIYLRKVPR